MEGEKRRWVDFLLHDASNYIQGARGYIEILKICGDKEKSDVYIQKSLEQLDKLVELLDYANILNKIEKKQLSLQKIDVEAYLRRFCTPESQGCVVNADPMLYDALDNLV